MTEIKKPGRMKFTAIKSFWKQLANTQRDILFVMTFKYQPPTYNLPNL